MSVVALAWLLVSCGPQPAPSSGSGQGAPELTVSTFNVRYGGATGSDAWYGEPGRSALVANQLDDEGTYHGFTGDTSGAPIDSVLCAAPLAPLHAEIVRWSADGVYPSDHYPVLSTLGVGGDGRQ